MNWTEIINQTLLQWQDWLYGTHNMPREDKEQSND